MSAGRVRRAQLDRAAAPKDARRPSFAVAGIGDALGVVGIVAMGAAIGGLGDDTADATVLFACGAVLTFVGLGIRRHFLRPRRSAPSRILTGLGLIWCCLVTAGALVYLTTGTITRIDDALVESTAGFTTTNLTVLDPSELSRSMVLWRAGTQWLGGYFGILLSVVALPEALRGSALFSNRSGGGDMDLVSDAATGRRRILGLYGGLTVVVAASYLATGLHPTEAVAHALSTTSTGGFSTNADSFVSYGTGPRLVATATMAISGASIFVLWWIVRGRVRPLRSSLELRLYLIIISVTTAVLLIDVDGISVRDALFTATSVVSTTGLAVGDWTSFSDDAAGVLLVVAAIGSMLGSAGGGFKVIRTQLLARMARRELKRQLDRHAVIAVKYGSEALNDRTLDRAAGYHIAHLMTVGVGALLLATLGVSLLGSVWGATSAVSTLGPAFGEIGSFGALDALAAPARLVLVPLMITGRLAVLPALVLIVWALSNERRAGRQARRLLASVGRVRRRGDGRG